ncbi:hypothetical protein BH11GEM1_BH11GEM1_25900 [soil metagenome]
MWLMNRIRRCALVAGAAALALNSACYAYQPVTGMPLAETQRVRLHLTTEGTAELARYLGPRVETADGILTRIRPDGELGVSVETVQLTDGSSQPWTGEGVVIFPASFIRRIERSELNRARTTIGALALAGGLFAIAAIALKTTGSQAGGDAGGGSPPP